MLKIWQPAVLVANTLQGSGSRVPSPEWRVAEVAVIEKVDEAMFLWEAEKQQRQVLSFINDGESRWFSTYAILVHYYKL